jgi:hypothetical protein
MTRSLACESVARLRPVYLTDWHKRACARKDAIIQFAFGKGVEPNIQLCCFESGRIEQQVKVVACPRNRFLSQIAKYRDPRKYC